VRPEDDCNFCLALLDAHCAVNGEPFCELKEEYMTTDIPADTMLDRFYGMVTDEQLVKTDLEVRRRMANLADPGRAAADRWLTNWRQGKNA
jgi:hypothetical protein